MKTELQACNKINAAIKTKTFILLQHLFYFIAHETTPLQIIYCF